jgi:leader peptidase (prepilin peptidase)/N-methyltransferase
MSGWAVAACALAGGLLGAVASVITRRWVRKQAQVARSWWVGAAVTAVVLTVLGWRVGVRGELAVYGFVVVLGVPLAVIDGVEHRLPRLVVWPQLAGAAAGFAILCLIRGDAGPGLRAVGAALAAAVFYLVLAVVVEGGVGSGDVNLAAVVGLVTGWVSWTALAGALMLASVLALLLLAVPQVRSRAGGSGGVPFGPCLLAGMVTAVALGMG